MDNGNNVAQGQSGNHTLLDIDIDAILNIQAKNDEGCTSEEWAEQLGVGNVKMRKILKLGFEKNMWKQGIQYRNHWSGRKIRHIVYKWVG